MAAPKKSSEEQKARFQSWHMTWHLGRKVFKQPYKPSIKGLLGWVGELLGGPGTSSVTPRLSVRAHPMSGTYCICEAWSSGENLKNYEIHENTITEITRCFTRCFPDCTIQFEANILMVFQAPAASEPTPKAETQAAGGWDEFGLWFAEMSRCVVMINDAMTTT